MEWLNYHHLYYFWVVSEAGSLAAAARRLRLTHSTLSAQMRALEDGLGTPLFDRRGRRMVLTPFGLEAASYASEIFRLGQELVDIGRGRSAPHRAVLRVGTVATLPKTLTHALLAPALDAYRDGSVQVRQGAPGALVEALAAGRLHVVLAEELPPECARLGIHGHVLGETDILVYGSRALAEGRRERYPQSLQGAPFVLPSPGTSLRRRFDQWLAERELRVRVVAELDDTGLSRVFAGAGRGLFLVRGAVRSEVEDLRDLVQVGSLDGIRERYFALCTQRRVRHPTVALIVDAARSGLHAAHPHRLRSIT